MALLIDGNVYVSKPKPKPAASTTKAWESAYAAADAGSLGVTPKKTAPSKPSTTPVVAHTAGTSSPSGGASPSTDSSTKRFAERQKDIDAIATASPAAAQKMQQELDADVKNRVADLDNQLKNLPTDSFSGYVRPALQAELDELRPPTAPSTTPSPRSFADRQKDIDTIVTASPSAAQAMQGNLNEEVEGARARANELEEQIQHLPTNSFSHIVRSELEAELAPVQNQLRDYDTFINPQATAGTDAGGLTLGAAFDDIDLQNPPNDVSGSFTSPEGVSYAVDVSSSVNEEPGPNGEDTVTLEISRSTEGGVSASAPLGVIEVGAGVFVGEELNFSLTIPSDAYQDILAGDAPFPDPSDLSTLPDDSFLLLRSEDVAGGSQSFGYGALQFSGSTSSSQGQALGLEVRDGTVRVLAGDTEAVEASSSVGLGREFKRGDLEIEASVSVGPSVSARETNLAFTDLDGPAGQQAYENFVRTGEIPPSYASGVTAAGTLKTADISASSNVSGTLALNGLEFETGISSELFSGSVTEVIYNDGRREVSGIVHGSGTSVFREQSFDADGRRSGDQTGLILDDYHESYNANVERVFGQDPGSSRNDAQIELSPAQYRELRDRVIDATAIDSAQAEAFRRGPDDQGNFTADDGSIGTVPHYDAFTDAIIANPDVDEFFFDPRIRTGGSSTVIDALINVYNDNPEAGALPGNYSFY